jgi:hypothetical protein
MGVVIDTGSLFLGSEAAARLISTWWSSIAQRLFPRSRRRRRGRLLSRPLV